MGLISTADCINRSREPYLVAQGYILKSPIGLIDRSLARTARLTRVAQSSSTNVDIRVALNRSADFVLVDNVVLSEHHASVSIFQVLVTPDEHVLLSQFPTWIQQSTTPEGSRRYLAYFGNLQQWGAESRAVIRVLGNPRYCNIGEVMAWEVKEQKFAPRMSDDVEPKERLTYTVTGTPVMGVMPRSGRRVYLSTATGLNYKDAILLRRQWLAQDIGLVVPTDSPIAGPAFFTQHVLDHGIVGLPLAGNGNFDGAGRGEITGSVQIGVVEIESSSLTLIEDAIMALAAYTLRPHAYRPSFGEYIAGFVGSSLTTQASAAGRYDVWPIVLPIDTTIDQAAFEVTGAATGDAAVVIHASDDLGRPAGLVAQSSPVSTGTTGLRTAALSATLRGGQQYWVGLWTQAAPTVRAVSDALPISWAAGAPHTARRVLRRVVTWGGTGPVWSYTASDPVAALPAAVLLRVA